MTAILIWRFMMNLQEARMGTSGSTGASAGQIASLVQFERFVGSIGEPLGHSLSLRDVYFVDDGVEGSEHPQGEGSTRSSAPA